MKQFEPYDYVVFKDEANTALQNCEGLDSVQAHRVLEVNEELEMILITDWEGAEWNWFLIEDFYKI